MVEIGFFWIVVLSIVLLAGFIQGLVGFGSGLVMVPILVLIIDPKILIPAVLIHGLVMNGALAFEAGKSIQIGRIAPILLGGLFGLPFGVYLLIFLSPDVLKIMIGSVIVLFGVLLLSGVNFHLRREKMFSIPIGLASGLLNGSVSMSGPPVILFFANQGVMKDNFRANLVTYFFFLNIFTLGVFAIMGLITIDVLVLAGVTLPLALVGIIIGTKVSKKVKENVFRRIALILVSLAGSVSFVSGLIAVIRSI